LEELRVETNFNRDKSLFDNKIISAREFETKKKEYLGALNSSETLKITVSNTMIQVNAIDVELTYGLTTSYHKVLTYKEQMTGKADIITKDVSVMDRIFFNFKKLIDQR